MGRHARPPHERKYQIMQLQDNHREITRLRALGYTNKNIAEMLGVTPQSVCNVSNSPLGRDRINELQGQRDEAVQNVRLEFQRIAPKALEVLRGMIEDDDEGTIRPALKAKVAQDLLDRAGYGAVKHIESVSTHLTADDIEELKRRANGTIVEVEARRLDVAQA